MQWIPSIIASLLLASLCVGNDQRSDPKPIIYPGQVNVAFLSALHESDGTEEGGCGPLRTDAVQRAMAAVWAAHQANFGKDDPQELNIGVYIYDTCGREDVAERQVYQLLGHVGHVQTTDCSKQRIPPLFAVITEGDTEHLKVPLKLLNSFSVPVISATGPPLPKVHLLSTAPSTVALARAAVSVLSQLRLLEVAVLAEDDAPTGLFGDFRRQAQVSGMQALQMDHGSEHSDDDFLASLKVVSEYGKTRLKAVVFLLNSDEALNLLRMVDDSNLPQIPWLIVTPSDISPMLNETFQKTQLAKLSKVLILSPETTTIPEFDEYFQQLLGEDTVKYHPLLLEFLDVVNGNTTYETSTPQPLLDPPSTANTSTSFAAADVSSTVKAVWTLAAALRNVQRRSCRRGTDCLLYLTRSLSAYVARAATTLDDTFGTGTESLKDMRLKFANEGELASVRYGLRGFSEEGDIIEVGYYSDETGLNVDHDVLMPFSEFVFVEPLSSSSSDSTISESDAEGTPASTTEVTSATNSSGEAADLLPTTTASPTADYIGWKILEETTVAEQTTSDNKASQATHDVLTSDLDRDVDLVLTLHDEANLQVLSEKNSTTNREDEGPRSSVVRGPTYSNERRGDSSSNMRSISLTSHQEPKINDAYIAEPGSRSDRRVDDVLHPSPPSSPSEDVRVVEASSSRHVSAWLGRPWALSMLGVCGFLILATLYVLVFLMVKACEGTLKKTNCCLAGTQLVALLCLYVAAALYTWKPSPLLCGLQRMLPNVSLAFCYGSLLLKGMFLRAQNTLGLGGSVNRCNQMLTLLFIVGVQVAMEVQWWLMRPPAISTEAFECATTKWEIMQSQIYVSVLLIMATGMALSTRRIPYNQAESRSLIATTFSCLLILLSWDVACFLLPSASSRDIAAPTALAATALAVLLGVFGPQLLAIHRYGGFPHKPLSYADSLSTVFTMFKDLDGTSSGGTTARGRKNAKTLDTPFAAEMAEGTRNPLYSDYQSAYP